jgi:hypothetical protein
MTTTEYHIGYAYPTSPIAQRIAASTSRHGGSRDIYRQGCYYYSGPDDDLVAFGSVADAEEHARSTGLQPDRWSIDHPANAKFRRDYA